MWTRRHTRSISSILFYSFLTIAACALIPSATLGVGFGGSPGDPIPFPNHETALQRLGDWPFGSATAVAFDAPRNLVYLGSGGGILVLDVSDIANPQLLSADINTHGLVTGLRYDAANERLLVAAGLEGLQIWDVQVPSSPQLLSVSQVEVTGVSPPIRNVDLYDHFALVECKWIGAASFDVSDPYHPVQIGLNSSMGANATDIHVSSDGYLHAVGAQYYVRIPIQPDGGIPGVGGIPLGNARVVFGTENAAFVERYGELLTIDLGGGGGYQLNSTDVGYFYDMVVEGNLAYLAGGSSLMIYDVSDLANPFLVGSLDIGADKLEVSGSFAYLASGYDGLRIVDISDPSQPVEVGSYDTFGISRNAFVQGDRCYIAQGPVGIVTIDLADLADPGFLGRYDTPGSAHDIVVADDLAYVADYDGGLRIADLSDPANPVEIGVAALDYAYDVALAGDTAYVVDNVLNEPDWIRIFDVSDPASPTEIGSILMQSDIRQLEVSNGHLFAAADDSGLIVLDVTDPTTPVVVGGIPAENTWDLCVRGDRVYLASADWHGGLMIVDASDPANPVLLSNYVPNGGWSHPFDVSVSGDFAYLSSPTNTTGQIAIVYIGDPLAPVEVDSYTVPGGDVRDLTAVDDLLFVSSGGAGLLVLENQLFSVPGGGVGWLAQESGTTSDLRAVHFADPENGWVAGDEGTILSTTDGGNEWQPQVSGTGEDLFTVHFVDANTGWVGGRGGIILKTTDGGATWQPQVSGTTEQIRAIQFLDADLGWAVGGGGVILKTTDGGASWLPQTSGVDTYLMSVCFVDPNHGWIAGGSGADALTLKTTNGGDDWQMVYTPPPAVSLGSIHFVNQDVGWVVGYDATIFKSVDGGDTWSLQFTDSLNSYTSFMSVYAINENTCWAVGYRGVEGRSMKTMSRGDSWMDMYGGGDEIMDAVFFTDQSNGWAVGHYGTIYAASTNQVPSDIVIGVPDQDSTPAGRPLLAQNYPNPFNPGTTISYDLPGPARVSLKIYDVSGRLVRVLEDAVAEPAGHHQVGWEGRDRFGRAVAAGVYFYRLEAGKYAETRRMLLLK